MFTSPYVASLITSMNASTKTLLPLELALMGEPGYFWCDSDFLETISTSMKSVKVADGLARVSNEDEAFEAFTILTPVCVMCFEEYLRKHGMSRPELLFVKQA